VDTAERGDRGESRPKDRVILQITILSIGYDVSQER